MPAHRDAKRNELLEARRRSSTTPLLVALLPLSSDVDTQHLWTSLITAGTAANNSSSHQQQQQQPGSHMEVTASSSSSSNSTYCMTYLSLQGRSRHQVVLLPPPADRADPLAVVDVARTADLVLLLLPGEDKTLGVDPQGEMALQILRAMGMPSTIAVVVTQHNQEQQQQQEVVDGEAMAMEEDAPATAAAAGGVGSSSSSGGAGLSMKDRAAARKRVEKVLTAFLPVDSLRLMHGDSAADVSALLRAVADTPVHPPQWRKQRPNLVVQAAAFTPNQQQQQEEEEEDQQQQQQQQLGELSLTGYVRAMGLSANQLVTVPGAGDFQIVRIESAVDPHAGGKGARQQQGGKKGLGAAGGGDMEVEMGEAGGVLAVPDAEQQEQLLRENAVLGGMEDEQTWPTDEELKDAEAAAATAGGKTRRRRLPAGTSDYQAAWIIDDDDQSDDYIDGSDEENDQEGMGDGGIPQLVGGVAGRGGGGGDPGDYGEEGDLDLDLGEGDVGTDAMIDEEEEEEGEGGGGGAARKAQLKAQVAAAAEEDAEYPDEVDTPDGVSARVRFQRYRSLKSFRSSPWDPRDGLPREYGRVWAFENSKRTAKKAMELAVSVNGGGMGWGGRGVRGLRGGSLR